MGYSYPGPAESLEVFLGEKYSSLLVISHPLNKTSERKSRLRLYSNGQIIMEIVKTRHIPYPFGLLFDPFIFPKAFLHRFDIIIGFNVLSTFYGALIKSIKTHRDYSVLASWGVDFVPPQGRNIIFRTIERVLNLINRKLLDFRVEMTDRARQARSIQSKKTQLILNPIGLDDSDFINFSDLVKKDDHRFVYLGSLNTRTGVEFVIDVIAKLCKVFPTTKLDLIGTGELRGKLEQKVKDFGIVDNVTFHGYLSEGKELQGILESASYGFAPYPRIENSFTYYADPQKIKRYMGSGLVVLTTRETEISTTIESRECGLVFDSEENSAVWARSIIEIMKDEVRLNSYQKSSYTLSKNFSNNEIFGATLKRLLSSKLNKEKAGL